MAAKHKYECRQLPIAIYTVKMPTMLLHTKKFQDGCQVTEIF